MKILSKKEFANRLEIDQARASLLLDRFCPELFTGTNATVRGSRSGRHYRYRLKKMYVQNMTSYAYEQSENARRECDRNKWFNLFNNLQKLEKEV